MGYRFAASNLDHVNLTQPTASWLEFSVANTLVTNEEVVLVDRVVKEVLARHGKGGSLVTILKDVQDKCAYLPEEAMIHIARGLGIPASEVYEVATFYSFLSAEPLGENTIRICRSTPCFLKNSEIIVKAVEKELGISVGETTEDGKFSLHLTNCIGACDKAPAMLVNGKLYGNLTPKSVKDTLDELKLTTQGILLK